MNYRDDGGLLPETMAERLRMTAADAEHDAACEHFAEAAGLAMTVMAQDERIERLEAVAKAARDFIEEYRDMNGGEGPHDPVTRRLAAALADLDRFANERTAP